MLHPWVNEDEFEVATSKGLGGESFTRKFNL